MLNSECGMPVLEQYADSAFAIPSSAFGRVSLPHDPGCPEQEQGGNIQEPGACIDGPGSNGAFRGGVQSEEESRGDYGAQNSAACKGQEKTSPAHGAEGGEKRRAVALGGRGRTRHRHHEEHRGKPEEDPAEEGRRALPGDWPLAGRWQSSAQAWPPRARPAQSASALSPS